jgi:hypothetical protein
MTVYVFIQPCGCITGAATPEAADLIADVIRAGARVEPRDSPISIPQSCQQHRGKLEGVAASFPAADERGGR